MVSAPRTLGVICARGGSKGLPRKNVLDLGGRPLIAWSVAAAAGASTLDRTIVSTDDAEIADAARSAGGDVPFLRPAELASDDAAISGALIHALDALPEKYDVVVLLQGTSPLRTPADIDATVDALRNSDADSAVTVVRQTKTPEMYMGIDGEGMIIRGAAAGLFQRRQEQGAYYLPNGAVYAVRCSHLRKTRQVYADRTIAVEMPLERSVDIDTRLDLAVARALIG